MTQGFELDVSGWVTTQGITRVASNAGTPAIAASSGGYYAVAEHNFQLTATNDALAIDNVRTALLPYP